MKIEGIKGTLFPYQLEGVKFFIKNNGKAILADTMGLGKTLQSLAYVVQSKKKKTIVICPSSVKYVWAGEVKKWTHLKYLVIDSQTKLTKKKLDKYDIFIINYDILKKYGYLLHAAKFNCLICDEFHYIKNIKAKRTQYVRAIAKGIPSIILMSGTPLLSRPVELFNGLNLMDPTVWNNWIRFTIRYCAGKKGYFGWECKGATNIDELKERMGKYFLRRTKEEVLTQLPPKRFVSYPVRLESSILKKYRLAEISFIDYLKAEKKKVFKEMGAGALRLKKLNALREMTSNGKIEAAKDIIQNIVDSGEKVVVFSMYNNPLTELHETFKSSSVLLTGGTPDKKRRDMIERFQKDDKLKVFFGGMKSAGVGITLTSASNVLFIDYSWVPGDHSQAVDRVHRIGQTAESITAYQMFSKNTIDEQMNNTLRKKQKIFDRLIEKDNVNTGLFENNESSLMQGVLKELEKKEVKYFTSTKLGV